MSAPTQELVDDIFRRRVLQARRTPPVDRLLDGARLFDFACSITLSGIQNQHPGLAEEDALLILRQRLDLRRKIEAAAMATHREASHDE